MKKLVGDRREVKRRKKVLSSISEIITEMEQIFDYLFVFKRTQEVQEKVRTEKAERTLSDHILTEACEQMCELDKSRSVCQTTVGSEGDMDFVTPSKLSRK